MEENKKKSINFFAVLAIAFVVVIAAGIGFGYLTGLEKEEVHVEEQTLSGIDEVQTEEELEKEYIADSFEGYEYNETDYGNKKDPSKKYVYVVDDRTVDYGYDDGSGNNVLYHIVVNIDSEDTNKLNKEFEEYYNKYVSVYSDEQAIKEEKQLPELTYTYFTKDEVLTLHVFYGNEDEGFENFKSYNIDIKNKKILSNEEFLTKIGMNKEKFMQYFDEKLHEKFYECEDTTGEYAINYGTFDNYMKEVGFSRNEEAEGKEVNFENICKYCYIYFPHSDYGDVLEIQNIMVPSAYGSDDPFGDDIQIEMEPKYIYTRSYSYRYQNFSTYNENYGPYASNIVPIINLKSKDADKVNKELFDFFTKGKDAIEKNGKEIITKAVETDELMELSPGEYVHTMDEIIVNKNNEQVIDNYYTIDFASQLIGGKVLSVLVEETNSRFSDLDHGLWDYYVYNFDIETGKLLTNKEFLEKLGYSADDFMKKYGATDDIESLNIVPMGKDESFYPQKYDKTPIKKDKLNVLYVFKDHKSFEWDRVNM